MQLNTQKKVLTLLPAGDQAFCVVSAVRHAMSLAPTTSLSDPLLKFSDGNVMPVSFVEKVWHEQLVKMGMKKLLFR